MKHAIYKMITNNKVRMTWNKRPSAVSTKISKQSQIETEEDHETCQATSFLVKVRRQAFVNTE